MTLRRTLVASSIAAIVALTLTACSNDGGDGSDKAAATTSVSATTTQAPQSSTQPPSSETTPPPPVTTTTEPTTTTTAPTTTTFAPTTVTEEAIVVPAVPSDGELQGKLQAALNGSANELESGDPGSITIVRDRIALIPGYTWSVSGGSVSGDVLSANLQSCLGQCFPIPVTWKNIDGTWKLSRESQDTLVSYANLTGDY